MNFIVGKHIAISDISHGHFDCQERSAVVLSRCPHFYQRHAYHNHFSNVAFAKSVLALPKSTHQNPSGAMHLRLTSARNSEPLLPRLGCRPILIVRIRRLLLDTTWSLSSGS